ncbi:MAG: NADH-quinone oxidoreductase subunit L [Spirochaetia bacterium]|nr:NADH-quinone oxidoreductase subunit L [Spirochaetia bacterium]
MIENVWLITALPLAGFIIIGLLGNRFGEKLSGIIASLFSSLAFIVTAMIFIEVLTKEESARKIVVKLFDWIVAGKINASVAYQIDPLSLVMTLVVTGVGSLIHFYSIGYMHGDKLSAKYFAYLNLFMFSMLNLVLGSNLLIMFLGWEGVGLCSYLLIGYYYETKEAGDAGKKAFIVNRIGDFGFLIGIFLIIFVFGTLDFSELEHLAKDHHSGELVIFWITLMLFIGATGKSAQIPLYVWLPDAMAGPTPVSALIHAATMVTSGVYMLARLSFLYVKAPETMFIICIIGALTALFAATIGMLQNDIKKVLAYSTVSQLGYMFMGVGAGAFSAGIFHVVTHAFFKALLFLGAGSVIYAMHHEQDIRNMGGLRKKLPITHITFLIGTLAIAGTPLFSGFFSKDEILWKVFNYSPAIWVIGATGALITSYYMFRLYFVTFYGESRSHDHHGLDGHDQGVHESPLIMTLPLIILAVLALAGGFLGIPHILDIFHSGNIIEEFLHHSVSDNAVVSHGKYMEILLMGISVLLAFVGFIFSYKLFFKNKGIPRKDEEYAGLQKTVYNKYYIDEIYNIAFVKSIYHFALVLWRAFDVFVIDGIVNGVARLLKNLGQGMRETETGVVHDYMMYMAGGLVSFFVLLFLFYL